MSSDLNKLSDTLTHLKLRYLTPTSHLFHVLNFNSAPHYLSLVFFLSGAMYGAKTGTLMCGIKKLNFALKTKRQLKKEFYIGTEEK